jgi:predicted phosphoribosyltransferase
MVFKNREQAGKMLALRLKKYKGTECALLALPRGGVPVAAEIATVLKVPVQVLLVRKIGAPFEPEVALGAICEDAEPFWNQDLLERIGLTALDLQPVVKKERAKIRSQREKFRPRSLTSTAPNVAGQTAIVVDDGLATGATMMAAVQYLEGKGAKAIVVAVPVAPETTLQKLRDRGVETVSLESPRDLISVGQWYGDFSQVSDSEVVSLLEQSPS